jgi:two-component system NarL family sensor kinase
MKKILIKKTTFCCSVIYLLFIGTNLFAGNIDSLKNEISKSKEDTSKVKQYRILIEELEKTDIKDAVLYAEECLKFSKKINYHKGIAVSYNLLGKVYSNVPDYDKSIEFYNKSLDTYNQIERKKTSDILYNIALVYERKNDYKAAASYLIQSLKIDEKYNNQDGAAWTLVEIGYVYKKLNNNLKAVEYYKKAKLLSEKINVDEVSIIALNNIGNCYNEDKKYDTALIYYSQSLEIAKRTNNVYRIVTIMDNIAAIYFEKKDYQKALNCFLQSIEKYNKNLDKQDISIAYINIAEVYGKTQQYEKALEYLQKSLSIAKEIHSQEQLKTAYQSLSEVYKDLKQYKLALEYSELYSTIKDSIYDKEVSKQVSEMETKYETEKKEKAIALLNVDIQSKQKDKELLETQVEKRNSIIYGTVSGALLLIASIVLLFNRRQLRQKNKHQSEIFKQQESTAISILEGQENERARIAKDLHDSVGTFLSTLKINLELFEGAIAKEKTESYHAALELIDKISAELRNIMKNLSNETLQEYGLVNAFEDLIARINRLGGTQFNFHSQGLSVRPENIIEINLYRVGQELLSNCIKYAKASNATLQLMARENKILLMLEDNGTGFDIQNPGSINKDHGMGLKNVRDRVSFIKGTVQIESDSVNGTTFIIETPQKIN